MKHLLILITVLVLSLLMSCSKDKKQISMMPAAEEEVKLLPFTEIELIDLSAFKPVSKNWNIVGNVTADRIKKQTFNTSEGTGVLLNMPKKDAKEHLFSNFEHGDIELEFDVMMPVQSNSGIYFQGRYEIQLLDSWGVKTPKHSDIGGIYQRWNNDAKDGKNGYEGHAPKLNAAKAPGLWQHFKIIFHAPKFDDAGNKIKNAQFEKVLLNGMLLHKNIDISGPTRAAAFNDEKPLGPLMLQGDHGTVAFKNIKYKLYENKAIGIKNSVLNIYDNPHRIHVIKNTDSLKKISQVKTDSISPMMRVDRNGQNTLIYSGTLSIPDSGDYLFEMKVSGGAFLVINKDTIINMNNDFKLDTTAFKKVNLLKGDVPYTLLYNKPLPWRRGFDLYVEGPEIQRYSIQKTSLDDLKKNQSMKQITINVTDEPITQRSFIVHKGVKRTHCISVGLVEQLNYSFDLATGSLLQVWGGEFLNTTPMWHSRGQDQIGEPMSFTITSHGDLDFSFLQNDTDKWPENLNKNINLIPLGYEFNDKQIPKFSFKIDDTEISNTFITSSKDKRGLIRIINVKSKAPIWHKIADGSNIKALPNHTFIVNNESYYINFSENKNLKPKIRSSNGKDELLVKIPKGETTINYSIIW